MATVGIKGLTRSLAGQRHAFHGHNWHGPDFLIIGILNVAFPVTFNAPH